MSLSLSENRPEPVQFDDAPTTTQEAVELSRVGPSCNTELTERVFPAAEIVSVAFPPTQFPLKEAGMTTAGPPPPPPATPAPPPPPAPASPAMSGPPEMQQVLDTSLRIDSIKKQFPAPVLLRAKGLISVHATHRGSPAQAVAQANGVSEPGPALRRLLPSILRLPRIPGPIGVPTACGPDTQH